MIEMILSKVNAGFDDPVPYNNALVWLFRGHVESRWPGSRHWSPDKIRPADSGIGVKVDIPGASRAFHDIDIYPKNVNWLTIPLHPFLVGMSAKTQDGLFRPRKKGGEMMNVLAKKMESGALTFMYALSKHVHQRRDETLLPTENEMFGAIYEEYCRRLA